MRRSSLAFQPFSSPSSDSPTAAVPETGEDTFFKAVRTVAAKKKTVETLEKMGMSKEFIEQLKSE